MKKIALFMALLAATGCLSAQDTLNIAGPKSNYYSNFWIDSGSFTIMDGPSYSISCDTLGKGFVTDDSLTVYGLASVMVTPFYGRGWYGRDVSLFDTSVTNCKDDLFLFQLQSDSTKKMIQCGEGLPIIWEVTPVAYYIDFNTYLEDCATPAPPVPVYEQYFDTPQRVTDTFYVCQSLRYRKKVSEKYPMPFGPIRFTTCDGLIHYSEYELSAAHLHNEVDGWDEPYWNFYSNPFWSFVFPILTPEPAPIDTTLAVQKDDVMGRYVNILPNPATERVEITSSLGMTHIEAYDADGRKVGRFSASGYKTTLDVTAWPRGTYLLRITTPVGTVTKKLLVQ